MAISKGYPASGWYGSGLVKPVKLDVQFTVTPTNGLGVTSVKSNGYVRNVFMHTSVTPTSNNGYLNPNPANGLVSIQMNNNYNAYIGSQISVISPNTGSAISISGTSVLTVGVMYVISSVGTSTAANWYAVGLPQGSTPAVGLSFVATVTGGGTGTGQVMAAGSSAIDWFEIIGNPQLSTNSSIAANGGWWLNGQFLASTSNSVTTLIPTAPVATSVISVAMYFDASAVTIDGL